MKVYFLQDREGTFYLRQKNPLEASRYLVSNEAYQVHEKLYEEAASILLNPNFEKKEYLESELRLQWQYLSDTTWIDISEPNFIGTQTTDYRQVFIYTGLEKVASYQSKVNSWLVACFSEEVATNIPERSLRFLEEAFELVQACGLDQIAAQRLLTCVYNREPGNRAQEAGGVMVTLASLCSAVNVNMRTEGEKELDRVIGKMPEIREKQQFKTGHGITATT